MDNVNQILRDNEFRFNKQFGQNFITDSNLLKAIVFDSGVTECDTVLEIGTGAGTLTKAIADVAKRVVSFEVDRNLLPILERTLIGYDDKVELIFKDIMRVADDELDEILGGEYRLIANLPYYITTPIIMRFLERVNKPKSITIMVQKEVAERLTARAGTADYGAITVAVDLVGTARIDRIVKKEMFMPSPKVDSAVVTIDVLDKYKGVDIAKVKKVLKSAFAMRRKTLSNNLMALGLSREKANESIRSLGLDERIRGEMLTTEQFIALTKAINN